MIRYLISSFFLLWVSLPASAVPLKVVTSIYPLQLIAESVLGTHGEVTTLLPAGQSPHDFALKVSDRRKLADAELLLWVSPALEPYLVGIAAEQRSVSMSDEPLSEASLAHREHSHQQDPHLWLSIYEVESFTHQLISHLAVLDPDNSNEYRANGEHFIEALQSIALAYPATDEVLPYAVAHRAYDHLLESFSFPQPIVLSESPEISPGARSLWRASQSLGQGDCLIVDTSNSQRWLMTFAQRNDLTIKRVDLMGVQSGVSTYNILISRIAEVFESCSRGARGEEKTPALVKNREERVSAGKSDDKPLQLTSEQKPQALD
jgi:zinc transport system substrate-binding protein